MARRYFSRAYSLTPPSRGIWIVALILGFLGILSYFIPMEEISAYNFWLVAIAFILLVIGTSSRGI